MNAKEINTLVVN